MKPINAAERRSQFVKFALLFLLAMVPVAIFISSFNRIERQAYETLRKERNELRIASTHNKEHDDLVKEIYKEGSELRTRVLSLESALIELKEKKDGELVNDLTELKRAIDRLEREGGGARSDADLILFARDMETTVSKLRDVYEAAFKEVKGKREGLEKLNTDYTILQATLTTTQGELSNCKTARGY